MSIFDAELFVFGESLVRLLRAVMLSLADELLSILCCVAVLALLNPSMLCFRSPQAAQEDLAAQAAMGQQPTLMKASFAFFLACFAGDRLLNAWSANPTCAICWCLQVCCLAQSIACC